MKIKNKKGTIISDLNSWESAFLEIDKKKEHWKEGRSAYSLASFFSTPSVEQSKGKEKIFSFLNKCGYKNVSLDVAEIEHESIFDAYRNSRIQDMFIKGSVDGNTCVICVEAKVDEVFNDTIKKAYDKAVKYLENHPNSKQKARIKDLCYRFFKKHPEEVGELRYQLLYYLAGSICEAKKANSNIVFMPVLVFKTDDYNEKKGIVNKYDYDNFMNTMEFDCKDNIYKNLVEDITVYSAYLEIHGESLKIVN